MSPCGNEAAPPPITPRERYHVVKTWASLNDVTRLAEYTGFDRLDIPNFYAIRPSALHPCAIVSSGKGLTKTAAMLSALFECYERWAAEEPFGPVLTTSANQLRREFPSVSLAAPTDLAADQSIPWVVGFDLISHRPCFVPLKKVIFPYAASLPAIPVTSNTNGLAAGVEPVETICGALLEALERDAVSRLNERRLPLVNLSSASGQSVTLLERFRDRGIELGVADCPSPFDVPTFYCLTRDDRLSMGSMFCSGSAADLDPMKALTRALLEVTQSRVAFISTLRDDVGPQIVRQLAVDYEARSASLSHWFSKADLQPLRQPLRHERRPATVPVAPRAALDSLLTRIRDVRPEMTVACARLREFPGLCCFRVYSPALHEPVKA